MYSKKVCILGAPAVGKSSLIRRFLGAELSETYHATTGSDIEKVVLELEADKVQLMLWDIQGMDGSAHGYAHYLKGIFAILTSSRDGCGVDTAFNLIARVTLGKSSLVAA